MLSKLAYDWPTLERHWLSQLDYFLKDYKGVMVSCSGGLDSTVLLSVVCELLKDKKKIHLAIFHMNFGLRSKDSERDQAFLEELADQHQLPIFAHRAESRSSQKAKSQVQSWARDCRYQKLREYAAQGWLIALGHHQDDVAENILLRLARGTSPGAMAGLREWHPPFWRPFLALPKAKLQQWASDHRLAYREDASNAERLYHRNIIRHDILPLLEKLFPGAAARIARCGEEAWQLGAFCNRTLAQEIACLQRGEGLAVSWLRAQGKELAIHLLSQAIGPVKAKRKALNYDFLEKAWQLIDSQAADKRLQQLQIPAGGGYINRRQGKISLQRQGKAPHSQRLAQHAPCIYQWQSDYVLANGARLESFSYRRDGLPLTKISLSPLGLGPQKLRVFLPASEARFYFAAQDKSWSLKEIMVINGIPSGTRPLLLVTAISPSGELHQAVVALGFIWQARYWEPGPTGTLLEKDFIR